VSTDKQPPLYTRFAGDRLLENSLLNKGSAFSTYERQRFNLEGLLPHTTETIEEQEERSYQQLKHFTSDLNKHIYLRNIQDANETLFYKLIRNHVEEVMPLIYTPTVGEACQEFSHNYRRKRGLFVDYPNKGRIAKILRNVGNEDVKVIVVTDGERILGLGDQGIGGMGIPVGKLSLYTACGGIAPEHTLPIVLDVGCNNKALTDDPLYMGWRHPRIIGEQYDEFVDEFVQAVKQRWPNVLLQFEDFAQANAMPLLKRYKDQLCCFNDDIQGTAAVTVGTLIAASYARGEKLRDQRIGFVGAGSAGCGIASQIIAQLVREGLDEAQAKRQVFMVDRFGLLVDSMTNLLDFQRPLIQKQTDLQDWSIDDINSINLMEVVKEAHLTVLIGVSGQPGIFTREVIEAMAAGTDRPIILPLSNPTSRVEAQPKDVIAWTDGKAIIATGSPFDPVFYKDHSYDIAQCNNSFIFPGIGLGILASGAKRVTDNMMLAPSTALAELSPLVANGTGGLLPRLSDSRHVSMHIATAMAKQAMVDGVAKQLSDESLAESIEKIYWDPIYRPYERIAD